MSFTFILIKIKNPVHIMVSEVVSSDGDVMTPIIFPHGLTHHRGLHHVSLWIEMVAILHKKKDPVLAMRKILQPFHS